MYNTLKQTSMMVQGQSIDAIGRKLIDIARGAIASIADIVMQLINVGVVPIALIVLIITILFLIINIAAIKHQQNNEGLEEKIKYLIICLVIFVVIGGYGLIFGDLLKFIIG